MKQTKNDMQNEANQARKFLLYTGYTRGTWWRSWLRHCAKIQKVVGSIPDGVIGIFH